MKELSDKIEGVSTHSRTKAAAAINNLKVRGDTFQHTAARRRLLLLTTSRSVVTRFNTQPHEGGCLT